LSYNTAERISQARRLGIHVRNSGGVDALRTGGTNLGWDFAELKPNTKYKRDELGKQIRKRQKNQGYTGTGAGYVWSGSDDSYAFSLWGLWKDGKFVKGSRKK
jgi:hypothetical protein